MNLRDDLVEYIRNNYDAEDIWPDTHDDCILDLYDAAYDAGWLNPSDPETYDMDIVADMAERIGLTLGADQRKVDTYHDSEQHGGAVRWCTHPLCAGE